MRIKVWISSQELHNKYTLSGLNLYRNVKKLKKHPLKDLILIECKKFKLPHYFPGSSQFSRGANKLRSLILQ